VRLFFDEDRGKGVAIALNAVGVATCYVGPNQPVHKQTDDRDWIPRAGQFGWLVITANKAILTTQHERELWDRAWRWRRFPDNQSLEGNR
jgi:hypothetical protein